LANFIPVDRDKAGDTLSVLEDVSRAHKAAMATVALAWLGGRPGVTSVIIGARTMAQLRDNLKAAEITLSGEETARLDEVSAIPMPYPQWMIGYMRQDR
jgi:aryl-alcohol dehydrogenase-like predicted oxidoreductase